MIKALILSSAVSLLLLLPHCKSHSADQAPPVKPFIPATGKIYHGKTFLAFDRHNIMLVADRYTNFEMVKSDTVSAMRFANNISGFMNRVYLFTEHGLQYKIPINKSDTVWLNAASFASFTYVNSKIDTIALDHGEAFFDLRDSLKIIIGDSLLIRSGKNAVFNIKNLVNKSFIKISLVRGTVNISGNQKDNKLTTSLSTPGQEVIISSLGYPGTIHQDLLPAQIGSWREANTLLLNESNFPEIMDRIDRWYHTKTIYDGNRLTYRVTPLSMSHDKHLDTALNIIQSFFQVKLTRRNDSILVTASK